MMRERMYKLQAELCKTLAHPIRLAILDHCKEGEKSVGELLELTGVSKANLSQHLGVLRHKHIMVTRKQGAKVYYRIVNGKIIAACNTMREVLMEQLAEYGRMQEYIEHSLQMEKDR